MTRSRICTKHQPPIWIQQCRSLKHILTSMLVCAAWMGSSLYHLTTSAFPILSSLNPSSPAYPNPSLTYLPLILLSLHASQAQTTNPSFALLLEWSLLCTSLPSWGYCRPRVGARTLHPDQMGVLYTGASIWGLKTARAPCFSPAGTASTGSVHLSSFHLIA